MDKIPNGQNPKLEKIPNWTTFRIGYNPELDKIPKWTKFRIAQNPEWTKSKLEPTSKIKKVRINRVLTAGLCCKH